MTVLSLSIFLSWKIRVQRETPEPEPKELQHQHLHHSHSASSPSPKLSETNNHMNLTWTFPAAPEVSRHPVRTQVKCKPAETLKSDTEDTKREAEEQDVFHLDDVRL